MSATSISTSTIDEGTELELWDKPHQPRSGVFLRDGLA